jgi:hypothetical protein
MELSLSLTFASHSLRIKYQPSEGSMMIDLSTIQSLELIQNLQNAKSKDCLFGLINDGLTPMGTRLLRSNILQPSTQADLLKNRYDAVDELATKEEMFFDTRTGEICFRQPRRPLLIHNFQRSRYFRMWINFSQTFVITASFYPAKVIF